MTDSELQEEEREALLSIYDGDTSFNQLSPTVFQYKYGISDHTKSFLLEIKWGTNYPSEPPEINMDMFYNKHISSSLKHKIIDLASKEAEQFLGMSMTYSLFEFIKEKFDELIEEQCEEEVSVAEKIEKLDVTEHTEDQKKKQIKKEHLTKAQKRRQWDKATDKGEKPRGWDWVDIVKHLSQTGGKESNELATS